MLLRARLAWLGRWWRRSNSLSMATVEVSQNPNCGAMNWLSSIARQGRDTVSSKRTKSRVTWAAAGESVCDLKTKDHQITLKMGLMPTLTRGSNWGKTALWVSPRRGDFCVKTDRFECSNRKWWGIVLIGWAEREREQPNKQTFNDGKCKQVTFDQVAKKPHTRSLTNFL